MVWYLTCSLAIVPPDPSDHEANVSRMHLKLKQNYAVEEPVMPRDVLKMYVVLKLIPKCFSLKRLLVSVSAFIIYFTVKLIKLSCYID